VGEEKGRVGEGGEADERGREEREKRVHVQKELERITRGIGEGRSRKGKQKQREKVQWGRGEHCGGKVEGKNTSKKGKSGDAG
jgi:hypothetical protein